MVQSHDRGKKEREMSASVAIIKDSCPDPYQSLCMLKLQEDCTSQRKLFISVSCVISAKVATLENRPYTS